MMKYCSVGYGGPVLRGSIEFKADILQKIDREIFYLKKSGIIPNDEFSDFNSGWYSLIRKSQKTNKDLVVMQIVPI